MPFAGVAHLVERDLAKVEVASSSLVARSKNTTLQVVFFRVRLSAHRRVSQLPAATFFSLLRHISRSHDKEMGEADEI